ncbi:MAG: hypothetical protein RR336_08005, partial [Oscillospiraceae bacterium]
MQLYEEIFSSLAEEKLQVLIEAVKNNSSQIIEGRCYQALNKIKAVIQDDSLEDKDCFLKIEAIIESLESLGSNGGSR